MSHNPIEQMHTNESENATVLNVPPRTRRSTRRAVAEGNSTAESTNATAGGGTSSVSPAAGGAAAGGASDAAGGGGGAAAPVQSECNICCEKYNTSNHKQITCGYCDYFACRECCETYILNESVPKCMNTDCGREWSRKFMSSAFTSAFITKKYVPHREQVLFDRERALLLETQPFAEAQNTIRRTTNEIKTLRDESIRIKRRMFDLTILLNDQNRILAGINNRRDTAPQVRRFTYSCPKDDCRGFLDTSCWCGVCNNWTCKDCNEIIGPSKEVEHTCNPDSVATARLLARDSKPCPTCSTLIYKIDGCDQMWCTQCHTAFSWRTGNIETTVHNPHYYEWLRRSTGSVPRNPNDIIGGGGGEGCIGMNNNCGNNFRLTSNLARELSLLINVKIKNLTKTCPPDLSAIQCKSLIELLTYTVYVITEYIGAAIHIRQVCLNELDFNPIITNRLLRISYMLNEIGEDTFKIKIQRNEKRQLKYREIADVYGLIVDTVTDRIRQIYIDMQNNIDVIKIFEMFSELHELAKYSNECLLDISKTYKSRLIQVNKYTLRPATCYSLESSATLNDAITDNKYQTHLSVTTSIPDINKYFANVRRI